MKTLDPNSLEAKVRESRQMPATPIPQRVCVCKSFCKASGPTFTARTMSHAQTPDHLTQSFKVAARLFRVPTNELTEEMWQQVAPAHSFPVGTPLVADDGGRCLLAVYRSHGLVVLRRFEDPYTGSWSPTVLARRATEEDFAHYRVANADRYLTPCCTSCKP